MRKSKLYSVLLSVLVAFSLWMYVVNNVSKEGEATIAGIPVVLEGEAALNDQNLMITGVSSETASLRLSGPRSELSKVNAGNILLRVDVSKIGGPGEKIPLPFSYTFPGDVPNNALVVEEKKPGLIYLNVDYRRTKEIPVSIKWTGTRSENYLYDTENAVLDYPAVTVVGPAAVADQITQAVVEVDLSQRLSSVSESFRYTLCNEAGEPVDAESIVTNVEEIRVDLPIQRIKELKLKVDLVYGGGAGPENASVKLSLDTIRVSGGEAVLEALGDTYTLCTVNLVDVEKDFEQMCTINLPEGVTNQTGVSEVLAAVRLNGLKTKEFVIENIQSINVPEGMETEIISANLTVRVRGSEAEINALTEKDISAVVDFSNAEAGTATYKATITFSENFKTVGALKANPISATVKAKGE